MKKTQRHIFSRNIISYFIIIAEYVRSQLYHVEKRLTFTIASLASLRDDFAAAFLLGAESR